MSEYKLFTKRLGLIGLTNLLTSFSGIILLPILIKNIPIEEYGIWVQISVTVGLIPSLVMLGLPYTMVRFLAAEKKSDKIQEGFYSIAFIVILTSAIASLILLLFSEPIGVILFNNNLIIVKISSLIVFIECLNLLLLHFFRTFQQIKRYSVLLFLKTFISVTVVAYFVLSGYGIIGAAIALLISGIFVFLIMTSLVISEIGIKIPKFNHIKEYLAFGLPTVPGNMSSWVVNSSDRYVIGIFLGTAFVGYYSPGYALGSIINMFIAPLVFMLPAVLSNYYDKNNRNEVKTVLRYSLKYFLMLAIPSAFGLSLLSKPILTILSTPDIASQGYLITPFVAASAMLFGAYAVVTQILVLEKKTKIIGSIWVITAIANLGLNLIVVPYMGILGAAITTLVAYAFAFILNTYYAFKYITFNISSRFILKSIFASIAMSFIIIKWNPTGFFSIFITIGVCAVVYALLLLLLKGFNKEETQFFRELLKYR